MKRQQTRGRGVLAASSWKRSLCARIGRFASLAGAFLLAGTALAVDSDWTYTTSETEPKTVTITGYTGNDKALVVPSTLGGNTVTAIKAYALAENSTITSVEVPASVTFVGSRAFYNCPVLKTATFKGPVAAEGEAAQGVKANYLNRINSSHYLEFESVFANCPALKTVTFAEGQETIGDEFFYGCTSLAMVNMPNSVEAIEQYAFYGCTALKGITLSTGLATIGEDAFENCSVLASVSIPASVETISQKAFYNCP